MGQTGYSLINGLNIKKYVVEQLMDDLFKTATKDDSNTLLNLKLWPNRSLSKRDFSTTIFYTAIGMMIPIIPFLGDTTFFAILPFSIATILLLVFLVKLNYKSAELHEKITIQSNLITVERVEANGTVKTWQSNPYWTKVNFYERSEKVENYLTLSGQGKEIEIGSFLAPSERLELKQKIEIVISNI